ncbi:MAG: hypothetical protein IKD04_03385 [Clostridia bacterium]|nr:hypothetical protein [Clostridia bacterium]
MKKIITLLIAFVLLMSFAVIPASAADDLTLLNPCGDGDFTASSPMVFEVSDESPDGVCASIEYDTAGPVASFGSKVPETERAADANKNYLCFWIKTPYTECDSGIFVGLFETTIAGQEMIWNGHEKTQVSYSGQIVTIDKNGEKAYIDATRLLILKPGFEGYVAIPLEGAMHIHSGWKKDGVFDKSKISGVQIWFDGSHTAWDERYCFDNFTLAKDEASFVSMVEATGLSVKTATTTPVEDDTPDDTSSDDKTSSVTDSSTDTSSDTTVGSTNTDNENTNTGTTNGGDNRIGILILIIVIVLLLAAVAIIFIYKPAFLFGKKEEKVAEETTETKSEE